MKYLEKPSLSALSSKLNMVTEGDLKLNCRIELYSCSRFEWAVIVRQNVNDPEEAIKEVERRLPEGHGRRVHLPER